MTGKPKDITGQRFGRLLALHFVRIQNQKAVWMWRCDCGVEKEILARSVRDGKTTSCGCFRSEVNKGNTYNTQHGHSSRLNGRSKEYNSWESMKKRCSPSAPDDIKRRYFDKGITVCEEWATSFEAFIADMGSQPSNEKGIRWSLDRVDNSKGYCKENCRWATYFQQIYNRNLVCRSNTGEPNISLKTERGNEYYCVTMLRNGNRYSKLFSCRKYGKDVAIKLAMGWRDDLILKLEVESNAKTD